ncbi:hypothetical protein RB628_15145 [Streptomyces sp. ADMS]|uniref:hypothetical protein n=1 Tax=Streptomyces sp. ADMS TaxID=3071415 RepID=UPI00296FB8B9|nr:hypothetical protein [Streptomyces sp. ADMS]MDW4906636.1 hypothetical protein [Streptomyces sp. ADMS]
MTDADPRGAAGIADLARDARPPRPGPLAADRSAGGNALSATTGWERQYELWDSVASSVSP